MNEENKDYKQRLNKASTSHIVKEIMEEIKTSQKDFILSDTKSPII